MPSKDQFHDAVKQGLKKDGWIVTDDPLYLKVGRIEMYVDLAAEKIIAAEREGRQIAVEVKSFISPSVTTEFHRALGQFINYRFALRIKEPNRVLFLAVPIDTYKAFFTEPLIEGIIAEQQIKLIIYHAEEEVIVEWQE